MDTSKLEDPEYQPLKKGVFNLTLNDMELLVSQLDTLLQYTHYQSDEHKRKVIDFVTYATTEEKKMLETGVLLKRKYWFKGKIFP